MLINLRKDAEQLARKGGDATLEYFKKSFDLEYKKDRTPVTNADREAERLIRNGIEKRYPDHGVIGEEYGSEGEGKEIVWVIDPIDGTQSFVHGVPFYTTLIGVLVEGVPAVGIIYAPALGEMVTAAIGHGVSLNGQSCRTRPCNELGRATFLTTDVEHIYTHGFEKPFNELIGQTRLHRTWGDAYGHMMVATGRADIMFDPVLSIWDAAALLPVVTEAGGSFSDVNGVQTIDSGNALSCAGGIRADILNIFNKSDKE